MLDHPATLLYIGVVCLEDRLMASSSKSKGSVKTVEWWKHLRYRKRDQNKLVRKDGKKKIDQEKDYEDE